MTKVTLRILTVLLTALFCLSLGYSALAAEPPERKHPKEILVKLKPGRQANQVKGFAGAQISGRLRQAGVQKVTLPENTDLEQALSQYRNDPNVVYAEPNLKRIPFYVPNDPYLANQWYLDNINAKNAWNVSAGNAEIKVAIIDTGIDVSHPDLAGKIESPYNSVTLTESSSAVIDSLGHGTHVAGIVAASINNGIGVAGVGGNIGIMPIKADYYGEFYDSDLAEAIYYAVDNGARVINMSLGGYGTSQTLEEAVAYAVSNNVVVIAAAGNDSQNTPSYPAAFEGVIGVAACDEGDDIADFSNFGYYIDVAAPGVNILSTFPTYPSSAPEDYGYSSGTSMASPMVAGLAGLALSVDPTLTNDEVSSAILIGSEDLGTPGFDQLYGWGRINALRTLELLTALSVVGSNAADGRYLSAGEDIILTFNKPITTGALFSEITLCDGTDTPVPITAEVSGSQLIVDPDSVLALGSDYHLMIPADALNDSDGLALSGDYSFYFTTLNSLDFLDLSFSVTDAVQDPNQPVLYATDKFGKKLYSINYLDGTVNSITFDFMPERLELGLGEYSDELYVALLHHEHDSDLDEVNQSGAIAVIDRDDFTLKETLSITIDPFDIAAGRDGHLYVSSGSGQWTYLDSYNRSTGERVHQATIRHRSFIELHPDLERIYTIDTDVSPRNYTAYSIADGYFTEPPYPGGYDSPYHGTYDLNPAFAISPGGLLFNGSGVVFATAYERAGDMVFVTDTALPFADILFDEPNERYLYLSSNGDRVFVSDANFNELMSLDLSDRGKFIFERDGKLISILEEEIAGRPYVSALQVMDIPELVDIPDDSLEQVIRQLLDKPTGPINSAEMAALTEISADYWGINDLRGLEYAVNLEYLNIEGNNITDLSPLGNLDLIALNAEDNQITDISTLAGLQTLRYLQLNENGLIDIGALSTLTNLNVLLLGNNLVTDHSALSALNSLVALDLSYNRVSDLSPLSSLTSLYTLFLDNNEIADLSALQNLTNLEALFLDNNQVEDLTPLSPLTKLEWLFLADNNISNLTGLSNLIYLTHLDLSFNQAANLSSLSGLTNLLWLDLFSNNVSSLSPLVTLAENGGLIFDLFEYNLDLRENDLHLAANSPTYRDLQNLLATGVKVLHDPVVDTQSPQWPSRSTLSVSNLAATSLTLSWPAATDDIGVVSYEVYKNGNLLATRTNTQRSLNVTALTPDTSYTFTVYALDAAGNSSTLPLSATKKTLSDVGTSGGGGGGGGTEEDEEPLDEEDQEEPETVNGSSAANSTLSEEDGQRLETVVVDERKAINMLADKPRGSTLVINATGDAGKTVTQLTAKTVTELTKKDVSIEVKTPNGSYQLPISEINLPLLAKRLQLSVNDLTVRLIIAQVDPATAKAHENLISGKGFQQKTTPIDFSIEVLGDDKRAEVSSFGAYVGRTLKLSEKLDSDDLMGVVINRDGTLLPVPTYFSDESGKTVANIKRKTNSTYTIIENRKTYNDIVSHWAKEDIETLASKLIISGTSKSNFSPNSRITRAELAALLVRGLGLEPKVEPELYSDVKDTDWFAAVVGTAFREGIVSGYSDGTFKPHNYVTRAEAATMIVQALKLTGTAVTLTPTDNMKYFNQFYDGENIAPWARSAIAIAVKNNILRGNANGYFLPEGLCTRGEAAVMLKQMLALAKFI